MSELDDIRSVSNLASAPMIEAEKSAEQKSTELEEAQKEFAVAALNEHPGWKKIRARMEADIKKLRAHTGLDLKQYTDAQLGQTVRAERTAADILEARLKEVDDAVRAVANGRSR